MRSPRAAILVAGVLSVALNSARSMQAQDVSSFEKRVTVKVLNNGLTILVCERHEAPVFSFFTHVDVGSDRNIPALPGWLTCSSTWRSRERTRSAPRTGPRKGKRWTKWK